MNFDFYNEPSRTAKEKQNEQENYKKQHQIELKHSLLISLRK